MVAMTATPAVRTAPSFALSTDLRPSAAFGEEEALLAEAEALPRIEVALESADDAPAVALDSADDAWEVAEAMTLESDEAIDEAAEVAELAMEDVTEAMLDSADESALDALETAVPGTVVVEGRMTRVVEGPMETEGWGPGTSGLPISNWPD